MDEAEYCERVGIMREGRLLAMDTAKALKERVVPGEVWEVFTHPLRRGLDALHQMKGVFRVSLAGDHIRTITEAGVGRQYLVDGLVAQGAEVTDLTLGEPTLEDVFLSLTK